ncbi:MAG: PHP domain-containing protein, partial [Erysipelotrichaceae bacterium]|nr:PHP domain-containing protein [Erysipelotrichaceae bacterium]
MNFDISRFIEENNYTEEKAAYLDNFRVVDVLYRKSLDFAYIKAENDVVLPYGIYMDLLSYLKKNGLENLKLYIKARSQDLPIKEINLYLESYYHDNHSFRSCVPVIGEDGFILSYTDRNEYEHDFHDLEDLKLYFYDLGYRRNIEMKLKENVIGNIQVEEREALPAAKPEQPAVQIEQEKTEKPYYRQRKKEYTEIKIEDLEDGLSGVKFKGKIFKVDERKTKTGITIQTLYVKDETDAVVVKFVEGKRFSLKALKENKEGKCAYFYGNYRFDTYANDYIFEPDQLEFIDDIDVLIDDAEERRVELHAHTKLSEMDGVSSPSEVVEAAYRMKHRAVAITDHLCLQGFHEAYDRYRKIKKADPDADFKVLYGCEMNMVSPYLNIVYNPNDSLLSEMEYVVFDLETTGLSTRYDYIIEFGAVLMRRGTVVEQKDFFIKPPIEMSETTKKMTHITDENLKDARTFAECRDEILDFVKDRVLVAHNASFDVGFLNSELERIGCEKLSNPVIDTLDLSRSILKNRRYHSLGSLCRAYNIPYDENIAHRANYDADVLAQSFNFMLKDLSSNDVKTLNELANFQDEDAFVRNRAFHTTVLCRNQKGLKDLFRLISISNTDTLAVFGKANTKDENSEFIAEPRVFKDTINKHRENLLIGTACLNGELFETASTRSKEELAKVMSFYDYVEVQPLENYRFLYEDRGQFTKERLMQYLRDIIDEAKRQNKIIVATGDVHYVLKEEKILRDVYINAMPIHGGHHPLYIFDKEKRKNSVTPDQRFLNTKEMEDAFAWLDDEKLVHEIVVTNTNLIADMCDNVKPFPVELTPPKILDAFAVARKCNIIEEPFTSRNDVISADEYLREFVYYNAHRIYGDVLDDFIEKRLETELNAIIGNGYGVIYFVCHLMVKRSNDDGYIVGSRGSVGSSLVATLSNITEVNPLPPHYICPNCHKLIW